MTKRCLLPVAICFLFGLLFSLKYQYWLVFPFLILEVYIFLRLYKYDMKARGYMLTGLLLVSFLFAVIFGNNNESRKKYYLSRLESGDDILVQGCLYKKEQKKDRYYLYLDKGRVLIENESVLCGNILIVSDSMDYILGNTLVVRGVYKEFETARNEGGYDEREVNFNKGINMKIESVKNVTEYGKQNSFREELFRTKEKMKAVMGQFLEESDVGVLATIALGDRTELSVEDKESYTNAGLSHVLSVSGLHISLLCMGLFGFLRKIKLPIWPSIISASIFSIIYCVFTGANVSTIRAVGMFIISMLAMVLGEAYDIISALSLLCIIILIGNPYALFSAGFLLSFGAVIGIAITGNELVSFYSHLADRRDYLRKRKREIYGKRMPRMLEKVRKYFDDFEKMLLMNVGIILTTLPFVAWFYYEVPTLSLVVNVLVIPLMGILLGLGFLGSLLGCILHPLGVLVVPCGLIVAFYRIVAEGTNNFLFSRWIIGRPSTLSVILYYLILFSSLCVLKRLKAKVNLRIKENGMEIGEELTVFNNYNLFYFLSLLVLVLVLILGMQSLKDERPCIKMLDVGQGDGIYIRTSTGEDVFIDGGSSSMKHVGKYAIAPFLKYEGVGDIECWIISHTDEDHVSGLIELLEDDYHVENIYLSKYVVQDDNFEKIKHLCEEKKINIVFLNPDDMVDFGKEKIKCLYPINYGESGNDSSMVMFYEAKNWDVLFTGDIGQAQEIDLMKYWTWPDDNKTHILKVAHHGSKNSSDEAFLKMCAPDIALISAGKNNSYGHPHLSTLEKLENEHSKIHRTDIEGEITIK